MGDAATRSSIALMVVTPVLFGLATLVLKPRPRVLGAGAAAAFVLALSNFAIEAIAASRGWYQVHGALPMAGVAVSTNIAWFFLGWVFCLFYSRLPRSRVGLLTKLAVVMAAPFIGFLYDTAIASAVLGLVDFSPEMTPARIGAIWLALTALTVLVFEGAVRGLGLREAA